MAESKGLTVSPTDEHEANDRDETAEPAETDAVEAEQPEKAEQPEEAPEPVEQPAAAEPAEPVAYRMRRAPRYRAFGLTGLVIGVILGAVLALSSPANGDYSAQTILGYFVAIFALLGALLGCGAAVLLDRRKG